MVSAEHTPPAAPARPGWFTSLILLASLGLVTAGIFLPALRVDTFYFWSRQHSIYSGTMTFFDSGREWLGAGLLLVSIVFPLVKIVLALMTLASFSPGHVLTNGLLSVLAFLSRWSMTDVFILAMAVLVLDGRLLTAADLLDGAWYYAAGILLSTGAVYSLLMRARRWRLPSPPVPPALEDQPP